MTSTFRDEILRIAFEQGVVWLKTQELKEVNDLLEPICYYSSKHILGSTYVECELTPKGMLVAASC